MVIQPALTHQRAFVTLKYYEQYRTGQKGESPAESTRMSSVESHSTSSIGTVLYEIASFRTSDRNNHSTHNATAVCRSTASKPTGGTV